MGRAEPPDAHSLADLPDAVGASLPACVASLFFIEEPLCINGTG